MASLEDVRAIALSLPGVIEGDREQAAFSVLKKGKAKGFAWVWMERVDPKKPRVPQPEVIAVRVADAADKESLLASDERKFFTEPHYNGFPAVLVRLPEIEVEELAELLADAWRVQAPKDLVKAYDAE
jgi:hypothetical protein